MANWPKYIAVIIFFILPGPSVSGQEQLQDTSRVRLREITILGSRVPLPGVALTRLTQVIPAAQLENSPAADLAAALEYLPDLDVRQRGPAGIQSDVSLRGGTFDQNAILLNGINLNNPQTGHFSMDIPVPVSMVNRIEILPGSDVKSLGAGALTGSVNFVTGKPVVSGARLALSGGRWGYADVESSLKRLSGKSWQVTGIQWQRSGGYRENTDFSRLAGYFQHGTRWCGTEVGIMAGLLLKQFGANSFYTPKYPNQFERTGTGLAALTLEHSGPVNLRQSVYYRVHSDAFHLFRYEAPVWYTGPNHHLTGTAGLRLEAFRGDPLTRTTIAADYRHETVWSTVLGNPIPNPVRVPLTDTAFYTRRGIRQHGSLSVEQRAQVGPVEFNGSLVAHFSSLLRQRATLYPGLEAGTDIGRSVRLFINANRGFRLPTFTELHYRSPTHSGNPGLQPESAWHLESGARLKSGPWSGHLVGFYRFASQSIDWVRLPSETTWHAENLGRIQTAGAEALLAWSAPINGSIWPLRLDRLEAGFKRQFQHHAVSGYDSQYLLDYLVWKISVAADLRIRSKIVLSLRMTAQDRAGSYTGFTTEGDPVENEYLPFLLLDGKISWTGRVFSIYAACTNLLGVEYLDFGSIPQPGAWARIGLAIDLKEAGRSETD
ncbi:MAG: TonB-dependent receptor [Bacteroidales bacterium]